MASSTHLAVEGEAAESQGSPRHRPSSPGPGAGRHPGRRSPWAGRTPRPVLPSPP